MFRIGLPNERMMRQDGMTNDRNSECREVKVRSQLVITERTNEREK